MNMFARFDENPAMTLRVIKETKCYGRTDGRTHGRTDNVKTVYPLQTKFAGGINRENISKHLCTEVIQTLYLYPTRQTPKSNDSFDKVNCGTVNVACKGTS